jgi:hypothetical protein
MSQTRENIPPDFYHHKPLKRFYISGIIQDEALLGRLKIEYVRLLVSEMRLSGYVPRIDIDPDFTLRYNDSKDFFEFELSVHGVYSGKRKSEWIAGIDGTSLVPIQPSKLKESWQEEAQESSQN